MSHLKRFGLREGEPLNVLLIVTDSTRRDFVSAYDGDELAHTPNLDALGRDDKRDTVSRG